MQYCSTKLAGQLTELRPLEMLVVELGYHHDFSPALVGLVFVPANGRGYCRRVGAHSALPLTEDSGAPRKCAPSADKSVVDCRPHLIPRVCLKIFAGRVQCAYSLYPPPFFFHFSVVRSWGRGNKETD